MYPAHSTAFQPSYTSEDQYSILQELLVDHGHDDSEISRNSDWDTPLMLAARHGNVDVGVLLANRFPRSIPITNKLGLDAVCYVCFSLHATC
jgi:hypothetical protein